MLQQVTLSDYLENVPLTGKMNRNSCQDIFAAIANASVKVQKEVARAGLTSHVLGAAGNENVQGEEQQKLDILANDIFMDALRQFPDICGVGSEELDNIVTEGYDQKGDYVLLMDPLDGSSNIDVNVSIGTIFSVFRRKSAKGTACELDDFLQPGTEQVLAGYVLYGTSTMLVFTWGDGVMGFTLNPQDSTFYLSNEQIKTPVSGKIYSVNEGNYNSFAPNYQKYIDYCKSKENNLGKPYSARYIGSLVADFHRNMLKGGVYFYPGTASAPNGKLRLMYEANPLAWISEQSEGVATNGEQNIMQIQPTELHQRTPLVIGSREMVEFVDGL